MPYRRTAAVQARLDASRRAILGAARELLAEHGYAGCSVAAVAARAGVATGTVYQHFPSKSELATELFRLVCGQELAAVTTAAAREPDPVAAVVAFVRAFAGRALRAPRLAYALLAEPADPAVDAERLRLRAAFREVVAGRIADGMRLGVLPAQNPSTSAAALVGAVGEALVGPLATATAAYPSAGDAVSADRAAGDAASGDPVAELVTFVVRGLGAGGLGAGGIGATDA